MGYQKGTLTGIAGPPRPGFFINGLYFVPQDSPDLRGTSAENDFGKLLLLESPQPEELTQIRFAGQRPAIRLEATGLRTAAGPVTATNLPPHTATTSATDVFYRFSAYRNDRRVLAGRLAPRSYSTSDTDISVVPNGLAAVGRYAIPCRISAQYLFEIRPGAGVPILFGTVTPNYGLAGGGVEVFFPAGTGPGTVTFLRTIPVK